jgi:uncharacterized membrane protein YphA (DoxX/SURF4 family)
MAVEAVPSSVAYALLALRVTLGLFWLQWGLEKLVVPKNTPEIWGYFYGFALAPAVGYVFGVVEIAIALCMFLGVLRTPAYGAAMVLHAVTVAVTWRQLLHPWADPYSHLFIAGVPVLGALVALFLLRDRDRSVLGT